MAGGPTGGPKAMTWMDLGCTLLDSHPPTVRKLPGWKAFLHRAKALNSLHLPSALLPHSWVSLMNLNDSIEGELVRPFLLQFFTFWMNTRQTSVSRKLEGCPSNQYGLHPVHPSRSRAASQDRSAHSALSLCFSTCVSGPAAQVTRHLGNEDSWACPAPLNQSLPSTRTPGDHMHILTETLDPQRSFCEGLCHPVEWAFLLSGPPGISSWGPGLRSLVLLDLQWHWGSQRAIENDRSDWWFLPKSLFNMAWEPTRLHWAPQRPNQSRSESTCLHHDPLKPRARGYSANICWGEQAIITMGRFLRSTCWQTAQCASFYTTACPQGQGLCPQESPHHSKPCHPDLSPP